MKRQFAERYGELEQWHWWFRSRQRILERFLARELSGQGPLAIVSLGCGPAEGLAWLKSFAGPEGRVLGLDVELLHAQRLAAGCQYVVGSCEAPPIVSASFDVVLMLDVLEHLDNDTGALREALRLLRPNGLLVVTVPSLPSLWGGQDVVSHHKRRYTKRTLRQLFARVQVSQPRLAYFNSLLFPLIAPVRWGRSALGMADRARSDFDDNRPGLLNEALALVFGFERHLINRFPMPVGISLLASVRIGNSQASATP